MDPVRFRALLQLCRALIHPAHSPAVNENGRVEAQKLLKIAQRYLPSEDDPRWTVIWNEYARTLDLPHDIDEAVCLLKKATAHTPASMMARLNACRTWISAAQSCQHPSTLSAYETYIDLLGLHLMSIPSLDEQRTTLIMIPDLPTLGMDAAAVAIDAGEYEKAVELLERGRGILWARMRGYRRTLFGTQGPHSELARKFLDINRELEARAVSTRVRDQAHLHDMDLHSLLHNPSLPIPMNEESIHRDISRQRQLLQEREEIIQEIRKLDGFEYFLRPTPFQELKQAASDGPVVIVNISRLRCDALIISAALNVGLHVVPLSNKLFTSITSIVIGIWSTVRSPNASNEASKQAILADMLRCLWDLVAVPVKESLDLIPNLVPESGRQIRVWWCPTSYLFSMPIHAAGIAEQNIHFCDYYVSSYTASLSALISARNRTRPTSATLLLVGQPDISIPAVSTEISYIQGLSSNLVNVQSCIKADALPSTVVRSLESSSCQWVHFACHAFNNPESPLESYFQLWDGQKLTLMDLMNADLPKAELAFLAACHSASSMGNREDVRLYTLDESLHLASVMQFIGFSAVVGTLWAMADVDGPVITEAFYGYMLRDGGSGSSEGSAAALDAAARLLRENGVPLDRWVNFIHIGV
ncbi:CHAT domain-containing protein [Rhodocollybia butyracea]|uniref:CHAT domain-containing protein n=1 Tax=Rhodocollybia butyracea TaxID=206335 RepID=A0A9P5PCK4_9AGAR|nr:CHAT domain-containing protein [Rhodocollybia butyracea]